MHPSRANRVEIERDTAVSKSIPRDADYFFASVSGAGICASLGSVVAVASTLSPASLIGGGTVGAFPTRRGRRQSSASERCGSGTGARRCRGRAGRRGLGRLVGGETELPVRSTGWVSASPTFSGAADSISSVTWTATPVMLSWPPRVLAKELDHLLECLAGLVGVHALSGDLFLDGK
jgi:hypothetical protein